MTYSGVHVTFIFKHYQTLCTKKSNVIVQY